MSARTYDPAAHTGLCSSCGDVWQEDEAPTVCPACGFTGVVAFLPGRLPAHAIRAYEAGE